MKETGLIKKGKRELKNEENRKKLREAMEIIMEKYDYNTVTIRNICQVSGVSYGSFYNLYNSKEEFLMEYLTGDFTQYLENYYKEHAEFDALSEIGKSIDVFVCCARYNTEKGLRFIRGFYTPNNTSLYPNPKAPDEKYSFTPLLHMSEGYLAAAKAKGQLKKRADLKEITHAYCYLFNGITFNWCISDGAVDMVGQTETILKNYIKGFLK